VRTAWTATALTRLVASINRYLGEPAPAAVPAGEPVTPDWLSRGRWEIDVAGTRYPAEVSLRPMNDATRARVCVDKDAISTPWLALAGLG
jgi:hypothetical protein